MPDVYYFQKEEVTTPLYDTIATAATDGYFCCDNYTLAEIQFKVAIAQATKANAGKETGNVGVEAI